MQSKHLSTVILILVLSLTISACGPGQILGPTVTPSPTATPTPTATPRPTSTPTMTPTSTPIPIASILLAQGFERGNPSQTCSEGPCKIYYYSDMMMIATVFDSGKFVLERFPFSQDINMKQGPIYIDIVNSVYPKDVAEAIQGKGQPTTNGTMVKLPYNGEIGGYKYEVYAAHDDQLNMDEIVVSVTPIP